MLRDLIEKYAEKDLAARVNASAAILEGVGSAATGGIAELDDFAACGIRRAEDICELFTRNFYFGCEADDPINSWAFNTHINPFGARLKTLFGSDIGHFDVVNMAEVLEEAFELVEHGAITDADFRDFVFTNPVRFWGEANPRFFEGTAVESAAAKLLRGAPAAPAHA
jgi:hypothetical protein